MTYKGARCSYFRSLGRLRLDGNYESLECLASSPYPGALNRHFHLSVIKRTGQFVDKKGLIF